MQALVTRFKFVVRCAMAAMLVLAAGSAARAEVVSYISQTSPEVPLLNVLNSITGSSSNYQYVGNTISDQVANKVFASFGPATFTILQQYAGHKDYHRFGYYQAGTNPIGPNASLTGVTFVVGDMDQNPQTALTMDGSASPTGTFGLFFDDGAYAGERPLGYYTSELAYDPAQENHIAVFQEKDANGNQIAGSYLVACEDFKALGDQDYNDLVLRVTVGTPATPEPATMMLLGMGVAGVFASRRKRRR